MNTYILILALSFYTPAGETVQITEFSSKQACEIALTEAKKFWRTVDSDSKCISVEEYLKKQKLQQDLDNLKAKLND